MTKQTFIRKMIANAMRSQKNDLITDIYLNKNGGTQKYIPLQYKLYEYKEKK